MEHVSAIRSGAVILSIIGVLHSASSQVPTWDVKMSPALYDTLFQRDIFSDDYLPTISVATADSFRTDAQIRFKGHSTRYFPKKSYRIKFSSDFTRIRQLNFNSMYTDKSFLRESFAWLLYRDMGALAPAATYGRLHINGEDKGIFTLVDKIDKYFLRNRGRLSTAPMYSASDLYTASDLRPQPDSLLKLYYEKEIGDANDYSDIRALITSLNAADSAGFPAAVDSLFDFRSVLQWFAANTLLMAGDSYVKNYYLMHDTSQTPRRWVIIPWDYDLCMGRNGDFDIPYPAMLLNDGFAYTFPPISGPSSVLRDGFERSPVLMERLRAYCDTLLTTIWTETRLRQRIDSLAAIVRPYVGMDPDKWGTMIDFEEHVETLKYYVTARRNYLLKTFIHQPDGEYDLAFIHPAAPGVPCHAVAFDGRQIATATFSSTTGLDSLLVRVYPAENPPGLGADTARGHVRRWLEITPCPPEARFAATMQWMYSDYSIATREVSASVQDERLLRSYVYTGGSYSPLPSTINSYGNVVTLPVTDQECGAGKHIALLAPVSYAQTWFKVSPPTLWERWRGVVHMAGGALGAVGEHGTFVRSTDNGASWTEHTIGQNTTFTACLAGTDLFTCGEAGALYHSTNAGDSWARVPLATRRNLRSLWRASGDTLWLAGDGIVLTSPDGGATWSDTGADTSITYQSGLVANGTVVVAGDDGSLLRKSGVSWNKTSLSNGRHLHTLAADLGGALWCVGDSGSVFVSTNAGASWTTRNFPAPIALRAIAAHAGGIHVAGDGGAIYFSGDGGASWYRQYSGDTHDLTALLFVDPTNGFAFGNGGIILHTASGGTTTGIASGPMQPERFELLQNFPNPFNPKTIIQYTIPGAGGQGLGARVVVFDLLGREVEVLVNGQQQPGFHTVEFDAGKLASGVYLYRLEVGAFSMVKKMMLLR